MREKKRSDEFYKSIALDGVRFYTKPFVKLYINIFGATSFINKKISTEEKIRKLKNFKPDRVLSIVLVVFIFYYLVVYFADNTKSDNWFWSFHTGRVGNLTAELFGGLLFYFIAKHFQKGTDFKINQLYSEFEQTKKWEKFDRMIDFCNSGGVGHIMVIRNIVNPDDLKYNEHFRYVIKSTASEGESLRADKGTLLGSPIIKITSLQRREHMSKDEAQDYLYGPVRVGESYEILFRDKGWYLVVPDFNGKEHEYKFILHSPSTGAVYSPRDVNQITGDSEINKNEYEEIGNFLLDENYEISTEQGTMVSVYKSKESTKTYIQISRTGILREIFLCNRKDPNNSEDWELIVDNAWGLFTKYHDHKKIFRKLKRSLESEKIELYKYPFYEKSPRIVGY